MQFLHLDNLTLNSRSGPVVNALNEKFDHIQTKFTSIRCEQAKDLFINGEEYEGSSRDPIKFIFVEHKNKYIKKLRLLTTLTNSFFKSTEPHEQEERLRTLESIRQTKIQLSELDDAIGQLIMFLRHKVSNKEEVYMFLDASGATILIDKAILNSIVCEYITDAYPSPPAENVDDILARASTALNVFTNVNKDNSTATANSQGSLNIENPTSDGRSLNVENRIFVEGSTLFNDTVLNPTTGNSQSSRSLHPTYTELDDDDFHTPHQNRRRITFSNNVPGSISSPMRSDTARLNNLRITEPNTSPTSHTGTYHASQAISNTSQQNTIAHNTNLPLVPPSPLQIGSNNAISLYEIDKFLPDFSGEITDFPRFWSKFEQYVDKNPTLTDSAKVFLLEAKCKGDAATLIQATSCHGHYATYEEVREAIHSEFGDPHLIAQTLYQEMKTMKAVPSDPHRIRTAVRALKAKTNMIWQLQAQQVYPSEFRTWITRIFPSDFILNILRNVPIQASVYDLIEAMEIKATRYRNGILHDGITDKQLKDNNFIMYTQTSNNKSCFLCEKDHKVIDCNTYKSVSERRRKVQDAGLCYSCLSKDHNSAQCNRSRPCPICRGRHHIGICYDLYSLKSRSHSRDRRSSWNSSNVKYQRTERDNHRQSRYDKHDNNRHRSQSRDRQSSRSSYNRNRSYDNSNHRSKSRDSNRSYSRSSQNRERSYSRNDNKKRRDPTPYSKNRSYSKERNNSQTRSSEDRRTYFTECPQAKSLSMIVKAPMITSDDRDHYINILIDTGSNQSYITEELASKMRLKNGKTQKMNIQLFGSVGQTVQTTCHRIQLRHPSSNHIDLLVCSIPSICTPIHPQKLNNEDLDMINDKNLYLSRNPNEHTTIDVLLGIDYLHLLPNHDLPIIKLPSGLVASPTIYGYTISGRFTPQTSPKDYVKNTHTLMITATDESDDKIPRLQDMWDMESQWMFRNPSSLEEDNRIMQEFRDTVQFTKTGIYVQFPWKTDNKENLADNFQMAHARLRALHRKYANTDSKLWDEYNKVIQQQLQSGIIEKVEEHDINTKNPTYYIPHQAVFKESSSTTKVRIVLDASSHIKGELSLNDVVHKGPTFLPQLCGILMRLRIGAYLLSADVEKAFHMVFLQHSERDATRFLWLKDHNGPLHEHNIEIFRFARVPFGINASPFLLAAAIQSGFEKFADPSHKDTVLSNLYVDNMFLTGDDKQQLQSLSETSKEIFKKINMHLREFLSNSADIMDHIDPKDRAKSQECKILGVKWHPTSDTLSIQVSLNPSGCNNLTKRNITRAAHTTFDPTGLTAPLLTKARIFLQRLWEHKYEWDEPLNTPLTTEWKEIVDLHDNFKLQLPRMIIHKESNERTELCVFTDASSTCFAACAYIRILKNHKYQPHLIMCRHRLLPLPTKGRKITIPKAELTSIELGVRLAQFIQTELSLNISNVYIFNDSEIALTWLASSQKNLGLYVNNRIQNIRKTLQHFTELTIPFNIYHVPSEHNPADHATRGLSKEQFSTSNWIDGPQFLQNPIIPPHFKHFALPDEKEVQVLLTFEHYSHDRACSPCKKPTNSFRSFVRRTYTVLKAIATFKKLIDKNNHAINIRKLHDQAKMLCIRSAQQDVNLKHPPYNKLPITMNSDGILTCISRVSPTLQHILLDPRHWCTRAIILDLHTDNCHGMTQQTFTDLRRSYWLPSGRQLIRTTLRTCLTCRIRDQRPYKYPIMPSLPKHRVTLTRPFENIGIDLTGPFLTEYNLKSYKVWVVLITCMSTRAVHLEVADDLTAVTLLLALKRFIARRGIPSVILSDNGTNFIGGRNILEQQYTTSDTISQYCSTYNISWKFITPLSPWKGGFYERLMSIIKRCLKHSIYKVTNRILFDTIVVQAEAIMNSRPLTHTSTEIDEPDPLRPIDFLIPRAELLLPDEDTNAIASTNTTKRLLLERYHETKRYLNIFREKWETDYLQELRNRHQTRMQQGKYSATTPKVGDVVHLKLCEKKHQLGIITQLKGDPINSASVRVTNKDKRTTVTHTTIDRPINLLIPLEINAETTTPRRVRFAPHHSIINLIALMTCIILPAIADPDPYPSLIVCHPLGYQVTFSPYTTNLTVCAANECKTWSKPTSPVIQHLAASVLDHGYLLESRDFFSKTIRPLFNKQSCKQDSPCDSINCILCKEFFLHYSCWNLTPFVWLIIILLISPVVSFLYIRFIKPHIDRSHRNPFSVHFYPSNPSTPALSVLAHCPSQASFSSVASDASSTDIASNSRERTVRKSLPLSHTLPSLIVLIAIISQVSATCHQTTTLISPREVCESNNSSCKRIETVQLRFHREHESSCLVFHTEDQHSSPLTITVLNTTTVCDMRHLFYTASTTTNVQSSKRCPSSGSCSAEECANISPSDHILEFAEYNNYLGHTYCIESCGFIGCGCLLPTSGCLFYRTYQVEIHPNEYYRVYDCRHWHTVVYLHISYKTEFESYNQIIHISPYTQYRIFKHWNITLDNIVPTDPNYQTATFVASPMNTTAMVKDTEQFYFKCTEPNIDHCETTEACTCRPAMYTVNCDCKNTNLTNHFHADAALPHITPSYTVQDTSFGSTGYPTMVHRSFDVTLSIETDLSLLRSLVRTPPICIVRFLSLGGCFRCSTGAFARFTCYTHKKSHIRLTCDNDQTHFLECDPEGTINRVRFFSKTPNPVIQCYTSCSKQNVTIQGKIQLRPESLLSPTTNIVANSTNQGFSFDLLHPILDWSWSLIYTIFSKVICIFLIISFVLTCIEISTHILSSNIHYPTLGIACSVCLAIASPFLIIYRILSYTIRCLTHTNPRPSSSL